MTPQEALKTMTDAFNGAKNISLTKEQIQARIKELEIERDTLVDRLDTGAGIIDAKRQAKEDVEALEKFWVELLHDYEKVCDTLRELYHLI